jgi:hypothetical protein
VFALISFWPVDVFDQPRAGFSYYSVLRISDTPDPKGKYLFTYQTQEGAKTSFYISASDIFILSVADIRGETYSLEIPISVGKIPLHDFIVLICEAAFLNNKTVLRITTNGREVQRRTLDFKINVGSRAQGWQFAALDGAPLLVGEAGFFRSAMTNEQIEKLVENVRGAYKLPFK